ncbi:VCBS repeat-containing protein [bacterium]|nr:VCBS repeat-containing protein [bacterium]
MSTKTRRTVFMILLGLCMPVALIAQIEWERTDITTEFVGAYAVHAGDIDGDGDMDVIGAAAIDDGITWWENLNGEGTDWGEHPVGGVVSIASDVDAADVNGDGHMDILGTSYYSNEITWWENPGNNTDPWWGHLVEGLGGAYSVSPADINNDGYMDLVAAAVSDNLLAWYENLDGSGWQWLSHQIVAEFDEAYSVHVADMDNDGDIDVLGSAAHDNDIAWWANEDGVGLTWVRHNVDTSFDGVTSVYAEDIDGDGDLDVLGAGSRSDAITWWKNLGGTGQNWSERTINSDFDGAYEVHADDVDGDGDIDVLGAAIGDNEIAWWDNLTGTGLYWQKHRLTGSFDYASDVYTADLNGDGLTDILGTSYYTNTIAAWLQVRLPSDGVVVVNIIPAEFPMVVQHGESITYTLELTVSLDQPQAGYIWSSVTLPNGRVAGPVNGINYLFTPGTITFQNLQQVIPFAVPAGVYEWIVKVGPGLGNPIHADSFHFLVLE